jgi:hypothetical protein
MDGNRRADKCKATLRLLKPLLLTSLPPGGKFGGQRGNLGKLLTSISIEQTGS